MRRPGQIDPPELQKTAKQKAVRDKPVKQKQPGSKSQKQKATAKSVAQLRISGFSVLIFGVMVIGILILAPSIHTLIQQQQELTELRKERDDANQLVQGLTEERSRWADPSYIRAQARERIYYVLPGEHSFLVINDLYTEAKENSNHFSDQIQQTEIDWVGQLASSVLIAGLSEAEPDRLITPNFGE